jgi:hypothetical protein
MHKKNPESGEPKLESMVQVTYPGDHNNVKTEHLEKKISLLKATNN